MDGHVRARDTEDIMDMSLTEASALARSINEREGQFCAIAFDAGSFALIVIRDREYDTPSRDPIRDPLRYLKEIEAGSSHVERDPAIQDALREWLAAPSRI